MKHTSYLRAVSSFRVCGGKHDRSEYATWNASKYDTRLVISYRREHGSYMRNQKYPKRNHHAHSDGVDTNCSGEHRYCVCIVLADTYVVDVIWLM